MQNKNLVERAYEHARSGEHRSVSEVTNALKKDGFGRGGIEDHLGGKTIRRDLRSLCRESFVERTRSALVET